MDPLTFGENLSGKTTEFVMFNKAVTMSDSRDRLSVVNLPIYRRLSVLLNQWNLQMEIDSRTDSFFYFSFPPNYLFPPV